MDDKRFEVLAREVIVDTKKAVDLMSEVNELSSAAMNMPQNDDFRQLVEEISGKQKLAVEFVQNAMMQQKSLLTMQAESISKLLRRLD